MMISALFAVSAWIVASPAGTSRRTPPARTAVVDSGVVAARRRRWTRRSSRRPRSSAAPRRRRPVRGRRRVAAAAEQARAASAATRAASAFFRYTMNMLPPARPGVSSCSISALHARGARRVVGAHQHAVGARVGDQRHALRRVRRARRPASRFRRTSRLTSATMSSADAFFSVTSSGSPAGAWSSDAMIRSMRRRLSA